MLGGSLRLNVYYICFDKHTLYTCVSNLFRGGEIAQLVASLSATRSVLVSARYDPLVPERWNSITVLLTCSHQC